VTHPDQRVRDHEALQERLTRLSEASLRINESLDFDEVLQCVLDAARSLTAARYGVMTLWATPAACATSSPRASRRSRPGCSATEQPLWPITAPRPL